MNLETVDWNQFRVFYHVVKAGSFTKAAQNLHTFQPSLSRKIMALEASLKKRLLERSAKGVIPTEEGKALLETVDALFNVFSSYEEKFHKGEEPQGLVKVSLSKALPRLKISESLPKFLRIFPNMKVAFVEVNKDVGFNSYEVDAAIREFEEEAHNLEQNYLATSSIRLYASAEYLQLHGAPQHKEDLEEHRLIALGNPEELSCSSANWALRVGMPQGKYRSPSLCVSSIPEMVWAVQEGLGISALPEEYVKENSSMVVVLPDLPPLLVDLYYVYPTHYKETKRVTAYGEFLAQELKDFPSSSFYTS